MPKSNSSVNSGSERALSPLQEKIYRIIFEADTPAGKAFDVALLIFIVLSIILIMAESIQSLNQKYGELFRILEWVITIGFTVEYLLRIYCLKKPKQYIFSYFGIIDILSILPTYLGLVFASSHYLTVIRSLRLLRIFRIFKLNRFVKDSNTILIALRQSRRKILVFLFFILMINVVMGTIVFAFENETNPGFSSIPQSIYWAIVTLSTVGYGDISPITVGGKIIASIIMITGYSIIAVPTGIVSVEINKASKPENLEPRTCKSCLSEGHESDARYCNKCGEKL
ncbi:MAG: ion transporter [Flavobacteriales bacterium]|nr:ion transporter [Flavobacteriales bacterium]